MSHASFQSGKTFSKGFQGLLVKFVCKAPFNLAYSNLVMR